jgi:hypothetical protein
MNGIVSVRDKGKEERESDQYALSSKERKRKEGEKRGKGEAEKLISC